MQTDDANSNRASCRLAHGYESTMTPRNLLLIRGFSYVEASLKQAVYFSLTEASSEKISCQHGWT